MSKVRFWEETRRTDKPAREEEAARTVTSFAGARSEAMMNCSAPRTNYISNSLLPYATSRLLTLPPIIPNAAAIDDAALQLWNGFGNVIGPRSYLSGGATGPVGALGHPYIFPDFAVSMGPISSHPNRERLNTPRYRAENQGMALHINGSSGATLFLRSGTTYTFTYLTNPEFRHTSDVVDGILFSQDSVGGGPNSFVNAGYSGDENSDNRGGFQPQPLVGTRVCDPSDCINLGVDSWMLMADIYLVHTIAPCIGCRVIVLPGC